MYVTAYYSGPSVIPAAALLTGSLFAGLTLVAVTTRADFSILCGVLGSLLAHGLIVASLFFGFDLGVTFTVAMVVGLAAATLYSTTNAMLHYRTDQYVAVFLSLFAAVAYVLLSAHDPGLASALTPGAALWRPVSPCTLPWKGL